MNWYEPTGKQLIEWDKWKQSRPQVIKDLADVFPPWKLFLLKSTNQKVYAYSYFEDGTISVVVDGNFNAVIFARNVFGIKPEDLVECNLPDDLEVVGALLTEQ